MGDLEEDTENERKKERRGGEKHKTAEVTGHIDIPSEKNE